MMRPARLHITAVVLTATLALCPDAGARTWHVTEDGTGDAPDIPAAFDSSAVGDTILVGPGSYTLPQGREDIPVGTTLLSESGPLYTMLLPSESSIGLVSVLDDATLCGFWVRGLQVSLVGAVSALSNATIAHNVIESSGLSAVQIFSGEVHHNLIMGPAARGVYVPGYALNVNLHHNIILNGVDCDSGGFFSLCNNVLGTVDCPLDGSSFSLDPQFCGVDNYYLQSDSPCAPGNHPSGLPCGQIGPFPVGCGTVDTQEHSWGVVKSLYQSE